MTTTQKKFEALTASRYSKYHTRTHEGFFINTHDKYLKFSPAGIRGGMPNQIPTPVVYRAIAAAADEQRKIEVIRGLPIGLNTHHINFKLTADMLVNGFDSIRVLFTVYKSHLESLNALLDGTSQMTFDIGRVPFHNPGMFKDVTAFLDAFPDGKIVSVFKHVRTGEPRIYIMVPTSDSVIGKVRPIKIDLSFDAEDDKPLTQRSVLDIEL
jgi:hypothetical protein